jgi:hypothetical protein
MSEFEKAMNVTDAQLAHNLQVWNREQKKLEKKLENKKKNAQEKKFANMPFAVLKNVQAKR